MNNITDYEDWVKTNWTGPKSREYAAIGFGGEAGEVLNEIKKEMRDGMVRHYEVKDELGDALHYLVRLAQCYGLTLQEVAEFNVKKCEVRKAAGNKTNISVSKVNMDVAHF